MPERWLITKLELDRQETREILLVSLTLDGDDSRGMILQIFDAKSYTAFQVGAYLSFNVEL